ncbi:protein FAM107B isoform X3 [Syngnathus scovelli]|uniref:protein FAM107B isoform X3 n=1 Tax=Syngnathus scovelli TaxID=161590 RepID=UPI0021104A4F|nr:protein FAM107B isoform X3 [Syngnathus scovelli]
MEKEKGPSALASTDGRTHGKTDECPDDEISYRVAVLCSASAYDEMPAHQGRTAPAASCSYAPPPNYSTDLRDHDDLIKPRKLLNPVKCSRSHQELHRELMTCCKRSSGGVRVESNKPELERVLECRRRDRLLRERKLEEEAHRKISPLEAELRKRHQALEEMELEQQQGERDKLTAPEFVKVKENLRRTSCAGKEEKQV